MALKRIYMNDETIFYNILYQDADAVSIIPQVLNAYLMTAHRINKDGETITIPIKRTTGTITVVTGKDYIHPIVNIDEIKLIWDSNPTNATRVARVSIMYCDPNGCKKLLNFVIHQN